jgi:hypothetical protein
LKTGESAPPELRKTMNMKRILLVLLCCTLTLAANAGNGKKSVHEQQLNALITEYTFHDGLEVMRIGGLGTALLKPLLKFATIDSQDEDAQKTLKPIGQIRRIAVVDYSECDEKTRDRFSRRASKLLDDVEMLMEVKDGSDVMQMYAVSDSEGKTVNDFVLFAPRDCALICLYGTLPLEMLSELAN